MILLTFLKHYEGDFGFAESNTITIGVFDNKEEITKVKAELPYIEEKFQTQFNSGMNKYVETSITLDTILKQ